ncbi:hypothetical protein [Ovoidimarina sediminis]|uniref:hypothetical protein n=1 Tax=Ovoidimarina sediminis TaxID=3079856 RepID=UPI00290FDEB2|nr:hypothetical protein [Rhodophyticola sp. MJ-SS7]MDU8943849.1 hypothetical protein [Rhodophyticola sp. MJ-SS7]
MARKTQKPLKAKITEDHPFHEVITEAYRIFDYPKPGATGVCTDCCMEPEIERDFFTPEIAELPLHYLNDWFFAACEPELPKSIWAYLLPRVLEVLAVGGDAPATVGIEVSLNRYQTGRRENWSKAEWAVLDRFQRLYLRRTVAGTEPFLDDILCMFGIAGWPLDDLFAQVLEAPDEILIPRLWDDWCIGRPQIWLTEFWEGGGNSAAYDFYTSDAIYDRAVAFGLDESAPAALARKARDVASVIESARA